MTPLNYFKSTFHCYFANHVFENFSTVDIDRPRIYYLRFLYTVWSRWVTWFNSLLETHTHTRTRTQTSLQ